MTLFTTFASWESVLVHINEGKAIYYHAPLDRFPVRVSIIQQFKNGKLRIKVVSHSAFCGFTIDKSHLERMKYFG